eukprot:350861_1
MKLIVKYLKIFSDMRFFFFLSTLIFKMGIKHSTSINFLKRIEKQETPLKVVVVGSSNCGKSTFCNAWTQNQQSLSTTHVNRELTGIWKYKKQERPFKLWDTKEGVFIYDRLRRSCYRDTDIFLICYDVSNRKSVELIQNQFMPEITRHEPSANYLLLGLKTDVKSTTNIHYDAIIFNWTNIEIKGKLFVPTDICQLITKFAKFSKDKLVSQDEINKLCNKYRLQSLQHLQCSAVNFDGFKFNNDLYQKAKKWK